MASPGDMAAYYANAPEAPPEGASEEEMAAFEEAMAAFGEEMGPPPEPAWPAPGARREERVAHRRGW